MCFLLLFCPCIFRFLVCANKLRLYVGLNCGGMGSDEDLCGQYECVMMLMMICLVF